jgi:hypothetical protein
MSLLGVKQWIGGWLNERWRTELVLRAPGLARLARREWPDLCNRSEAVTKCDDGIGRICHWSDSSLLTVCRLFPKTGGRLLRQVWSPRMAAPPAPLSILLPVRGRERFEAVSCVAHAMSQLAGPDSEVLICEHAAVPQYDQPWPEGIRHVHVPAEEGRAFNKSRAMNAGARVARHPVLLLHDADVVPSPDYLCRSLELLSRGWEAVRPIRFLFLLDDGQTRHYLKRGAQEEIREIPGVQQNNPGLSTFVRRDTYMELGGHDERFEGWGGEDLEFLDRLRTRKLYPGAFLPAIHLWHPPADQKQSGHRNNDLLRRILQEPADRRIAQARRQFEGEGA